VVKIINRNRSQASAGIAHKERKLQHGVSSNYIDVIAEKHGDYLRGNNEVVTNKDFFPTFLLLSYS